MKKVSAVKMGFNKEAEVVLIADVDMEDGNDLDSLFLCYFTILVPPLRLAVITTDCLVERIARLQGVTTTDIETLITTKPNEYALLIQQNTDKLMEFGIEQSRIELDNEVAAQQARALVASILDRGYYVQKSHFHFPNNEVKTQEQQVPIGGMEPTFKAMLEVCKNWEETQI